MTDELKAQLQEEGMFMPTPDGIKVDEVTGTTGYYKVVSGFNAFKGDDGVWSIRGNLTLDTRFNGELKSSIGIPDGASLSGDAIVQVQSSIDAIVNALESTLAP